MKEVYRLEANGEKICQVRVPAPQWWPFVTHLSLVWLSQVVRIALVQRPVV